MEINDQDWQAVRTAYEIGRAMETNHGKAIKDLYGHAINEDRVRDDLQRLKRCLDKCSDDTLRLIDGHRYPTLFHSGYLTAVSEGQLPPGYFASGSFARHIAELSSLMVHPNEGPPAPYRHQFAVRLLRDHWPGKKELGKRMPYFNEFVQWLGQQLAKLDPTLSGPDDVAEADKAAYNALKAITPPSARRRNSTAPSSP
jgi:hypothetical protein